MSFFAKLLKRSPHVPDEAEDETPAELRHNNREGAYKVVTVTYPSGYIRKGIVVDLSPTGARIRFSQRGELPGRVSMRIEGMGGYRDAETVWQETHDAGVRFIG
ncbi:MAG: PilZ domain-containing protein [Pseudomonadota bacterium]